MKTKLMKSVAGLARLELKWRAFTGGHLTTLEGHALLICSLHARAGLPAHVLAAFDARRDAFSEGEDSSGFAQSVLDAAGIAQEPSLVAAL